MKKEYGIGIVILLTIVGGFFLFQNLGNGDPAKDTAEMVEINTDLATSTEGDDMENPDYVLDLKNYSFTPDLIEAEPGETIIVKITNSKGLHDFVIDELGITTLRINKGDEYVFTITVPEDVKSGTEYEFYCSVGDHRELGMVGVFRVL